MEKWVRGRSYGWRQRWARCSAGGVPGAVFVLAIFLLASSLSAQNPPASTQPVASAPSSAPSQAEQFGKLMLQIAGQSDPATRLEAAVQILRVGGAEGAKLLLPVFSTPNNEAAKLAVCEAIAKVGCNHADFREPLLALATGSNLLLREAAVVALEGYRGDSEVDRQLQAFEREMLVKTLVAHSIELYGLLPTETQIERLRQWLASPQSFMRDLALEIIRRELKTGADLPEETLSSLRAMLNDPDEGVREKLVIILRDLRQRDDARLLENRLRNKEPSARVRALIYHALGLIRDTESIPICVEGLKDPEDEVAANAAGALANLAKAVRPSSTPPELEPAVQGLLQRASAGLGDANLRENVINAMSSIADPAFLDVLAAHAGADEPLPAIRQAALVGIGRIGDAVRINLVIERLAAEKDPVIREVATLALGQLGSRLEHLQPLRERLDPQTETAQGVRLRATEAYRIIFMKLAPKDQQQALRSWPDELVRMASVAQMLPEVRQQVAERLIDVAQEVGQKDPGQSLSFLEKMAVALPPERLGGGLASRLDAVRKQLQVATRPASVPSLPE